MIFSYVIFSLVALSFSWLLISLVVRNNKLPTFIILTDFGYDFAVGTIKGVVLSRLPHARVYDLDHTIAKFNIISAGFVLAKSYHYFPQGTVFICVVDPGVGTSREPICIHTPSYSFIGPNNGVFDFILEKENRRTIYEIDSAYLKTGENTFHGRDLFAPASVDFYLGNREKFKLFPESRLVHVKASHDEAIITYIDSFGNIKTNKEIDSKFHQYIEITIKKRSYRVPFVKTFNEVNQGQLLCYRGSNSTLELAINQGSAEKELAVIVGDPVNVTYLS